MGGLAGPPALYVLDTTVSRMSRIFARVVYHVRRARVGGKKGQLAWIDRGRVASFDAVSRSGARQQLDKRVDVERVCRPVAVRRSGHRPDELVVPIVPGR